MSARERVSPSAAPVGSGVDLREEYWSLVTRTADLVVRLAELADRYEAVAADDPPERADQRRTHASAMRATAASGRELIAALTPPPAGRVEPTSADQADRLRLRDLQAAYRDELAERRDQRASDRDVRAHDVTPEVGFADRFMSACDRDDAAGDRADAQTDRQAASLVLERSTAGEAPAGQDTLGERLDERALLARAQGVLMAMEGVTAEQAREAIELASSRQEISEASVAGTIVAGASRRREVTPAVPT